MQVHPLAGGEVIPGGDGLADGSAGPDLVDLRGALLGDFGEGGAVGMLDEELAAAEVVGPGDQLPLELGGHEGDLLSAAGPPVGAFTRRRQEGGKA